MFENTKNTILVFSKFTHCFFLIFCFMCFKYIYLFYRTSYNNFLKLMSKKCSLKLFLENVTKHDLIICTRNSILNHIVLCTRRRLNG